MKKLAMLATALIATNAFAAAPRKTTAPRAEPAVCTGLAAEYSAADKKLAMLSAEDLGDDSAVRATMRETQSANILSRARMTMDLMKTNGCKGPASAPSDSKYLSEALSCVIKRLDQEVALAQAYRNKEKLVALDSPIECDMSRWKAK